ncbi:MAG: hypothetical protein ACOYON_03945, partial [Fimbriimonas sp.]
MNEVYCRDCARYDEAGNKCRDRKLNPQSWDNAVSVSQMFGIRSICAFNDHRERLVASQRPIAPKPKVPLLPTADG